MTAQTIGGEDNGAQSVGTPDAASRLLHARLNMMLSSMSTAVWLNPGLALLWMVPFLGMFPRLGSISWPQFVIIMAMQLFSSVGARIISRGYRRDPSNPACWLRRLMVYQTLTGVSWGIFAWLIWSDGNPLNNVLVTMTVCGIVWAYSTSRAMHVGVYMAGVVPTIVLILARIATAAGLIAIPLAVITAITFVLVYIVTYGLRRSVMLLFATQIANQDLAVELRSTRDEALRKRFEAEAANASKTTFLANMSHELRTPLNAILGFSDLISGEILGPVGTPRYREYAKDINTSGAHLLSLINDILDIAKIESGKMEISPGNLDPRVLLESALNVIRTRAAERKQSLTVDIDSDLDAVYSDERAFKQVVINLVSNAVKFTPVGGQINVALKHVGDNGCELCVSDNGPGISPNLLDQIFMPFNQVDNRYSRQAGGTGLGLSLVRGLAELHGGRAWIVSDVGKGVKAYVFLPGAPREALLRRA